MNYRSPKLLNLAKEVQSCLLCGAHRPNAIVAAHSNQLRDGKGKGIKAHDFRVAFICGECHYRLDQGKDLTKEERINLWEEAHRNTIEWLFLNNHIKII